RRGRSRRRVRGSADRALRAVAAEPVRYRRGSGLDRHGGEPRGTGRGGSGYRTAARRLPPVPPVHAGPHRGARLLDGRPGPRPRAVPDLPGGRLSDGVVELRPLGPADTVDVVALQALPEVAATTVGGAGRDLVRMCAEAAGEWLAGRTVRLAIRDAASGAFAGDIGLFNFEPVLGQA